MTTLIVANTAAATSAAFPMSGDGKIIAFLGEGESVTLQEEYPDGVYRTAIDKGGVGIVLTAYQGQMSAIFTGYGNYKVVKSATAAAVAVGLES